MEKNTNIFRKQCGMDLGIEQTWVLVLPLPLLPSMMLGKLVGIAVLVS